MQPLRYGIVQEFTSAAPSSAGEDRPPTTPSSRFSKPKFGIGHSAILYPKKEFSTGFALDFQESITRGQVAGSCFRLTSIRWVFEQIAKDAGVWPATDELAPSVIKVFAPPGSRPERCDAAQEAAHGTAKSSMTNS